MEKEDANKSKISIESSLLASAMVDSMFGPEDWDFCVHLKSGNKIFCSYKDDSELSGINFGLRYLVLKKRIIEDVCLEFIDHKGYIFLIAKDEVKFITIPPGGIVRGLHK